METTYRVLRIDEQLYGCEELPAGQAHPALPGQRAHPPWHRRGQHGRPDRRRNAEKGIKHRRHT